MLLPSSPSGSSRAVPDLPSHTRSGSSKIPPELIQDLIPEILVRIPLDDPACLVRASLACEPWRRLLTNPGFLHRYRALHRTPPILGFLCNVSGPAARFVSTSSFRPAAPDDRYYWHVLAAAHGRVLFHTITYNKCLVVWDPVTDQQWWVPTPVLPLLTTDYFHAAVFCAHASAGCNHLDCHGGPFRVAFVAINELGYTFARLYSSETGEWSEQIQIEEQVVIDRQPTILLGNSVYFACNAAVMPGILEYNMAKGELSLIEPPLLHRNQMGTILIRTEAGMLGFAGIYESRLHLWSREVDPHGIVAWAPHKAIELKTLLLARPKITPHVLGFAEGVGIIFVRLNSGVFSIELKSGNTKKVPYPGRICELRLGKTLKLFPYMCFCTPDRCNMKISTAC
uniref:Uncharacterized protein n=1 Tax=Avena sativa TaxID=4498 RepID=A0ACD5VF38_AVESA